MKKMETLEVSIQNLERVLRERSKVSLGESLNVLGGVSNLRNPGLELSQGEWVATQQNTCRANASAKAQLQEYHSISLHVSQDLLFLVKPERDIIIRDSMARHAKLSR